MTAGHDDLERAAEALATRLPEPLAAARAPRLQLPLVLGRPTGPSVFRAIDPDRWERVRGEPGAAAAGGRRRAARRAPRSDADAARARRRARGARRAPTSRAPPRDGLGHARAPDRVLLRRVRRPRLAPDLLRRPRRARRRHPQGGLRPRAAARRRRPAVPPRLLPPAHRRRRLAARVLGRHRPRPPARRARHRRRRRAAHDHRARRATIEVDGADLARRRRPRPALPARRRAPGERRRPRAGSRRACTSATRTRGSRSTCCSASAACARSRRSGSSPASCTSTRATRRSSSLELARARVQRQRLARAPRWRSRARRTIFTTHTPVPAGNDTYPAAPGRRGARAASRARSASTPRRSSALGRTQPGRGGRAVRRHASSRCARAAPPTASAAATARSRARCGTPMWADRAVDDVPIDHVTNGVHIPTWLGAADVGAARPPPRRGLAGPRDRPGDLGAASTTSPTPGAVGRAHARSAPQLIEYVRAPRRRRPARARRAAQLRRGGGARVRPRRADDRLRPPAGDLQAAATCCCRTSSARCALRRRRPPDPGRCWPARRTRATTTASALVQDLFSMQERAGLRRPRRLPRRLRPAHGARAWCAAATSGSTCRARRWRRAARQRHEERHQRRPAAAACSTAGGPRATTAATAGRCRATSTTTTAPRTRATRTSCFRLLEEEVAPEFYRARRRRHPARLGRARPPLAAHARAGVRRRADARGLRRAVLRRARGALSLTFRELAKYNVGMVANGIAHFDVFGPEPEALHAFYAGVFDWQIESKGPGYALVRTPDGAPDGAVVEVRHGGLTVGVAVPDLDATVAGGGSRRGGADAADRQRLGGQGAGRRPGGQPGLADRGLSAVDAAALDERLRALAHPVRRQLTWPASTSPRPRGGWSSSRPSRRPACRSISRCCARPGCWCSRRGDGSGSTRPTARFFVRPLPRWRRSRVPKVAGRLSEPPGFLVGYRGSGRAPRRRTGSSPGSRRGRRTRVAGSAGIGSDSFGPPFSGARRWRGRGDPVLRALNSLVDGWTDI